VKKIKIKGKDYVMAHERVKEFHNLYPNGSIKTEIVEMTERFITMTTVIPDVSIPERCFTGLAYEDISSNGVNSTSALENCETSSCARAMGMLNIGIDTSIASYEEVNNAIQQQKQKPKPTPKPNKEVVDMMHNVVNPPTLKDVKDKFGDDNVDLVKNLITFGKHNGQEWSKIPEDYIVWVAKNSKVEYQREQAEKELQRRNPKPTRQSGGMSEKAYQEDLEGMPL